MDADPLPSEREADPTGADAELEGGSVTGEVGEDVALQVASVEPAVQFYGTMFEIELHAREPGAAFISLGDQFIALFEPGGMGLALSKSQSALTELREAGLA